MTYSRRAAPGAGGLEKGRYGLVDLADLFVGLFDLVAEFLPADFQQPADSGRNPFGGHDFFQLLLALVQTGELLLLLDGSTAGRELVDRVAVAGQPAGELLPDRAVTGTAFQDRLAVGNGGEQGFPGGGGRRRGKVAGPLARALHSPDRDRPDRAP